MKKDEQFALLLPAKHTGHGLCMAAHGSLIGSVSGSEVIVSASIIHCPLFVYSQTFATIALIVIGSFQ